MPTLLVAIPSTLMLRIPIEEALGPEEIQEAIYLALDAQADDGDGFDFPALPGGRLEPGWDGNFKIIDGA